MGNKIEVSKVKQFITEISETTEINETFLKTEFQNLLALVGTDIKNNLPFQKIFKESIINLNETSFINFVKNLIDYMNIQLIEHSNSIKISLSILLLTIDSVYEKYKNLRELLIYSINFICNQKNKNGETKQEEMQNIIKNSFPFNILYFCFELYINDEFFLKKEFFNYEYEKFEMSFKLVKIIYSVIYFQKNNELTAKTYYEYFDAFKLFLSSEIIFPKEKIEKFILTLFFNTFLNLNSFLKNVMDSNIPKLDFDNFITTNFYLFLWFCFDINKFFFTDCVKTNVEFHEFYFENEFNEKIYQFVEQILFSGAESLDLSKNSSNEKFEENKVGRHSQTQILDVIKNYKVTYSNIIINAVLYNTNVLKEFIFQFFTNYERFSPNYKLTSKILILYMFEINHVRDNLFTFFIISGFL